MDASGSTTPRVSINPATGGFDVSVSDGGLRSVIARIRESDICPEHGTALDYARLIAQAWEDVRAQSKASMDALMEKVWNEGAKPEWLMFKDDNGYGVFVAPNTIIRDRAEIRAQCLAMMGFVPPDLDADAMRKGGAQ